MSDDGGEQDASGLFPQLAGAAESSSGAPGVCGVDFRTVLALAGHLSAGGWIILIHPWLITRPGQAPEIEMRAVGVVQGRG
jgi:hypothetical protein